jgi:hypothetical protein
MVRHELHADAAGPDTRSAIDQSLVVSATCETGRKYRIQREEKSEKTLAA